MSSVLFVCLGNICRSPVVEAVARAEFARAGLNVDVDSAGTGDYHVGQVADKRAIASAAKYGYDVTAHRARQVEAADFVRYDRILAMDQSNRRDLAVVCPAAHIERLQLFLPFAGIEAPTEVPDPYFGGAAGFDHVVELARRGIGGLIARMRSGA